MSGISPLNNAGALIIILTTTPFLIYGFTQNRNESWMNLFVMILYVVIVLRSKLHCN